MGFGVKSVIITLFHMDIFLISSLHLLLALVGVRIRERSHLCRFAATSTDILEKAEVSTSTSNHGDNNYDGGTKGW